MFLRAGLKPAVGSRLMCRSVVISPGKSIIVAESNLYSQPESVEKHVARATVTLMAVDARRLTSSKQSG